MRNILDYINENLFDTEDENDFIKDYDMGGYGVLTHIEDGVAHVKLKKDVNRQGFIDIQILGDNINRYNNIIKYYGIKKFLFYDTLQILATKSLDFKGISISTEAEIHKSLPTNRIDLYAQLHGVSQIKDLKLKTGTLRIINKLKLKNCELAAQKFEMDNIPILDNCKMEGEVLNFNLSMNELNNLNKLIDKEIKYDFVKEFNLDELPDNIKKVCIYGMYQRNPRYVFINKLHKIFNIYKDKNPVVGDWTLYRVGK